MPNDLAVLGPSAISILNPNSEAMEALRANTAIEPIRESDLVRVKNPGSGGLAWEIRAPGGVEYKPRLRGIILAIIGRRTLWAKKFDGNAERPACSSRDMLHGRLRTNEDGSLNIPESILQIARPGKGPNIECAGCAFNVWHGETPPMCKQSLIFYFLPSDSVLPLRMVCQTGGITQFKKDLKQLPVAHFYGVVDLYLVKDQSRKQPGKEGGIDYSRPQFDYVGPIAPEHRELIRQYRDTIFNLNPDEIEDDDGRSGSDSPPDDEGYTDR